jgi:predicted ATPase
MYVHIGKESVINSNNIMAIFNIKSLISRKNNLNDICKNIGISDNIIDVSEDKKKTLIVCNVDKTLKGYITNISSTTIAKRCNLKVC